jgi:beta-glucanase (GH16 family)
VDTKILARLVISMMFSSAQFSSTQAQPPPGYTLAFDEEFSAPLSVSDWGERPARWMAHTPYAGDFGDAYFTGYNEPNTPSPFKVTNGVLIITAYRDPNANYHWRSGLLASVDTHGNGFSQALGYFEIRMKLPAGVGVWPSFWLAGISGVQSPPVPGLKSAEIDILEQYGDDPTSAYQTVHVWGEAYGIGNWCCEYGMTSDYHTYAALVNPDYIHFYMDGVEQWKTPTPPEATQPLYVMVDLALGGGQSTDNTPNPSQLLVDYIRVYAPPGK